MIKPRIAPARLGLLVGFLLLAVTTAADAAPTINYRGRTSQRRPISFAVTGHAVSYFQYRIDDRCPDGKLLFVRTRGFPGMKIKRGRFGGWFSAKAPQKATAIVEGTVNGKTITGSISDRTQNPKTRVFCTGKAKFDLKRQ